MGFQPVPETAEINMVFTCNAVTVQNTFYGRRVGGYVLADLQALADAVDLAFPATWVSDMPPEVAYVRTDVRGLALENDLLATQNLSAGVGTHLSSALPNNVTFAVKKLSGFTGRSARGRNFWIGVPRDQLDDLNENLVDSAFAAIVVANIDFIRATINGVGTWSAVLVSRFADKAKRTTGVTFPWISTTNTDLRVDTSRARLPVS